MPDTTNYSIDLDLWRRALDAPKDEIWKWGWDIWSPVIDKIFAGEPDIRDLTCPVCGKKSLYAYFLAVKATPRDGESLRFTATRWFGCHACQTQVRDRGDTPPWLSEEDVVWAIEGLKERAEQKIGRRLKGSVHFTSR